MGNLLAESNALEWTAIVLGTLGFILAIANWLRDSGKDVREMVTQIVDARFLAADVAKAAIDQRLERGDASFDRLAQQSRDLDRMLSTSMAGLKDWMHENFASKKDMEHLNDRLDAMAGRT